MRIPQAVFVAAWRAAAAAGKSAVDLARELGYASSREVRRRANRMRAARIEDLPPLADGRATIDRYRKAREVVS